MRYHGRRQNPADEQRKALYQLGYDFLQSRIALQVATKSFHSQHFKREGLQMVIMEEKQLPDIDLSTT